MAHATPQATGSETKDTLCMASRAVAPMVPQTTAPISGPSASPGTVDQVQAKQDEDHPIENNRDQVSIIADNRKTIATNNPQDVTTTEIGTESDVEMIDHIEDVRPPPTSEEEISMLDRYSFHFNGKAYDHNVPQQLTNGTLLYIGRLHPQTATLMEHCQRAETKDEMDTCPPLIPDENEMNPEAKTSGGRKAIECVWVGMLPGWKTQVRTASDGSPPEQSCIVAAVDDSQVDGSAGKKTGIPKKTKSALRIADLTPNNMSNIPYDPTALRVVAKRSTKVTKVCYLYALLNPDPATKLCQGWRVGSDSVFYFKAFRGDEATGYLLRKQATQEKIRASIFYKEPINSPSLSQSTQPGSLPPTPSTGKFSHQSVSSPSSPSTGKFSHQSVSSPSSPSIAVRASEVFSKAPSKRFRSGNLSSEQPASKKTAVEADFDFNAMVNYMVQNITAAGFKVHKEEDTNAKKTGVKRRNVFFEGDDGKVSDTYGNAVDSHVDITSVEDDLDAEAKSLAIRHDLDRVTTKMMNLVMKMSNDKDLAGLSQSYMMLKCIEQRCVPSATSAVGMYLNVPPGEDGDPTACAVKLRELLDLFPQLEDIDMDNHVLAWVIRGLQLTGQSIDMELLPFYLASFSALFKAKFEDTANHQARLREDDLVNMICQARDDAEKMCGEETSPDKGSSSFKCPSHPYSKDVAKIWKVFDWTDPRQVAAPGEEDAESADV